MMAMFIEGWPLTVGAVVLLLFLAWRSLVSPKLLPHELRRSAFQVLGVGLMTLGVGHLLRYLPDSPDTWLHAWSFLLVRLGLVLSLCGAVQLWRSRKTN